MRRLTGLRLPKPFQCVALGQRIDHAGGHTSGFDYLRLGLALSVLCWHGVKAALGPAAERTYLNTPLHGVICLILPMFFALSGFLVCGSLERSRGLTTYVVHRLLRIVPALAVVVTISTLVLGPLLTQLPVATYLWHSDAGAYLLNIIFLVHFELPGVFQGTPEKFTVNASLWTIPYEIACYIGLLMLSVTGLLKRVRLLCLLVIVSWFYRTVQMLHRESASSLMHSTAPGRLLVVCFVAGVLIYQLRGKLPFSLPLALFSGAVSYGLLSRPETYFLAPFPTAYFTACLGATRPTKAPVLMDGDFSYGLYLCAFPVQQTLSALFPASRAYLSNVIISLVVAALYSYASWHMIEQPVLGQRKRVAEQVTAILMKVKSSLLTRVSAPSPYEDDGPTS